MSTVLPSTVAIPQPIPNGELVKLIENIPGSYCGQNSDSYKYTVPKGTIVRIHDSRPTRRALDGGGDELGYNYKFSLDMDDFKYYLVEDEGISVISELIPHTKLAILPTSSTNTREMRNDRFWKIGDVAYIRGPHKAPVAKRSPTGWVTVNVGDAIIVGSPAMTYKGRSERVSDYESAFYAFGMCHAVGTQTPVWHSTYYCGLHVFERV